MDENSIRKANKRPLETTTITMRVPVQVKADVLMAAAEQGLNTSQYMALMALRAVKASWNPAKESEQLDQLRKELEKARKSVATAKADAEKAKKALAAAEKAQKAAEATAAKASAGAKQKGADAATAAKKVKAAEDAATRAERATAAAKQAQQKAESGQAAAEANARKLKQRLDAANAWREKHNAGIKKGVFSGDPICPDPSPGAW